MKKLLILLIASSMSLAGCGPGFSLSDLTGNHNSGQDSSQTPNDPSAPAASWDNVVYEGKPDGGPDDQKLVAHIDKANQALILILPIPVLVPVIVPMPLSQIAGATLTTVTNGDGSQSMAVSIPLRKIVRNGLILPNQRLPNGDALPYVPAGELPGFGIAFPQMQNYRIYLYVGVNVAAVFVELADLGLPVGFITPVKNKTKTKVIGAVGYVVPKNNFNGGVYLAAQLPADLARIIENLIVW